MNAIVNAHLAFFIAVFLFSGHCTCKPTKADCLYQLFVRDVKWLNGWKNSYDWPLKTQCVDRALTGMQSVHDNVRQDRLFNFACSSIHYGSEHRKVGSCYWGAYSEWDGRFQYACKPNYFIVGWESYHNNGKEDRRMRYKCCTMDRFITKNCASTGWMNAFDEDFKRTVPEDNVIVLVDSLHSNYYEDRRFAFTYCNAFFD